MAGVTSDTSVTVAEGLRVVGGTEAEGVAGVTGAGFWRRMCRGGHMDWMNHILQQQKADET